MYSECNEQDIHESKLSEKKTVFMYCEIAQKSVCCCHHCKHFIPRHSLDYIHLVGLQERNRQIANKHMAV